MDKFNEIGNFVLREFISRAEGQGLVVSGMDPETGQVRLQGPTDILFWTRPPAPIG